MSISLAISVYATSIMLNTDEKLPLKYFRGNLEKPTGADIVNVFAIIS